MNQKELDEIIESYRWIKVKRFQDDENLFWEERFNALNEHHVKEITFLVEKVRELAKEFKEKQQ